MGEHILEIIVMLLIAATLGFFIGWFLRKNKIIELEAYITSLEDKNNRLQGEFNENELILIDCQTEKKKAEADKNRIEALLAECQNKLSAAEAVLTAKSEIDIVAKEEDANPETIVKTKPKKIKTSKKTTPKPDKLTKIEGIGPKLFGILKDAGIETFNKLSKTKADKISEILIAAGGNKYKRFDPTTWPDQAKLAAEDKWDELKKWQDELKGGKAK